MFSVNSIYKDVHLIHEDLFLNIEKSSFKFTMRNGAKISSREEWVAAKMLDVRT